MNYIITENRIHELKTNFLNGYIGDNVSRLDTYILIYNTSYDNEFENLEPFLEYDYSDGRLFINSDIKDNFMSLFGAENSEADEFISDWFSDKFGVTVEFTA
tara:strand:- start:210 stop:515 length:306 start_codon:yes stop_codon:yes gene_type:complete